MGLPSRRLAGAALAAALAGPALPVLADGQPPPIMTVGATATVGYDRIAVRRGDTWFLRDSLSGGPSRSYREHLAGWTPVAGDTDGDGQDSLTLFRDGLWLIREVERGAPWPAAFGMRGDQPVMGDWDGDGRDSLGVYRAGRFYLQGADAGATRVVPFGVPGDVAVVGDWDGDGDTDLGLRRGVTWFQRDSATPAPASRSFRFGNPGDVPVAGDWDHDGRDTPGVFRAGTWYFRGASGTQSTRFGKPGDLPVVRRAATLAPGVRHRIVRHHGVPYTAHVVTVDLAAPSSPDTVLAGDELRSLETVSSMARRTGAVAAVNGDYHLPSGRPVHLFASDGQLAQTPQLHGRALGFDARGTRVSMGFPELRVAVDATGLGLSADVSRVNSGSPDGGRVAAWTAAGRGLSSPPAEICYAGVTPAGGRTMTRDGLVRAPLTVTGQRCGGPPPLVPPTGAMLGAVRDPAGSAFVRALRPGQALTMSSLLGFPGAVDVLGGNPLVVDDGRVVDADVDGSGAFFGRHPRTAVGVTGDGRLLLVVVDGRQGAYSSGATLRELAELLRGLGAVDAINLDGGGSSEMWLNGLVVNRPSDGAERAVSTALVVLPGDDRGQGDLMTSPSASLQQPPDPLLGPASTDPASTGGLADALQRAGVRLPPELARTADAFRAG